jgi:hypothetical protein
MPSPARDHAGFPPRDAVAFEARCLLVRLAPAMSPVRSTLLAVAVATLPCSCANVLGLDQGLPESAGSGAEEDADGLGDPPDAYADGARVDATPSAADDGASWGDSADEETAHDAVAHEVGATPPEASPPPDAGAASDVSASDARTCGAPLAPCKTATDCCSGVCTLGLTCL